MVFFHKLFWGIADNIAQLLLAQWKEVCAVAQAFYEVSQERGRARIPIYILVIAMLAGEALWLLLISLTDCLQPIIEWYVGDGSREALIGLPQLVMRDMLFLFMLCSIAVMPLLVGIVLAGQQRGTVIVLSSVLVWLVGFFIISWMPT